MTQKNPSFKNFRPASPASSYAKRRNRWSDTQHELMLRSVLWRMGLRYRKNLKSLPGRPDIVFLAARVVVFCDGDFWHGRKWVELQSKLDNGTNADYWISKISKNKERDLRNSVLLEKDGWHVFRIWETDIRRDVMATALMIKQVVDLRMNRKTEGNEEDRLL